MKPTIGIIGGMWIVLHYRVLNNTKKYCSTAHGAGHRMNSWVGRLAGIEVAFLARHGRRHVHLAVGRLNFRANIYGWSNNSAGWRRTRSRSAPSVHSRKNTAPLRFVIPDQFSAAPRPRLRYFSAKRLRRTSQASLIRVCPQLSEVMRRGLHSIRGADVYKVRERIFAWRGPRFPQKSGDQAISQLGLDVIGTDHCVRG